MVFLSFVCMYFCFPVLSCVTFSNDHFYEIFIHPHTYWHCLSDVDPVVFSLRIKFYPAEPLRLTGNGKVMIYQQIKRDLIHGRLYCSAGEAVALGALIVQGKNCSFNCTHGMIYLQGKR